ncbi:serine/threonine protein kinase [Amycolatopsis antarctica]|uniref:non-specific serine/threonine protein kinase n=1 Tax=Amycolatopsis antarctica TaxID=1854586 RepID=A0A263D7P2_9PSEU|nr:serine/threonine-protein kinase [Amycolatopsis antarctica]OZM73506.1 serine/threonine protein kinase [Amycolatopsis antarctica]
MDSFASALLSLAHQLFQPGFCPGDWVWATSAAGALIALFPVLGAVVVAVIRKGTGNRYNGATIAVFAGIGLVTVLLIPWLLNTGVSETYRAVFTGSSSGLSIGETATLDREYCSFIGVQKEYLGSGQNVYETLFYPSGNKLAYGYYVGALVGLPALSLVFVMLQARTALRRGPKWPGRLLWIPFVAMVLCSVNVGANTAVHLWLGFLPIAVLGIIPVALVGAPSWSTIQRSHQDPSPPPQPEPQRTPPPPPPQQPPPAPAKQYPATSVAPVQEQQELAAAPGPVPVPFGSGQAGSSRYRRIRRLGHGGFGTVWQAVDNQLGRTVALKIAHAPDRDTEERMQREARALATINHPNCVRVYDLVEEPDGLALVMEYLDGQPLGAAVDTVGPLDDTRAGRLWATMAGALVAAHEKGVLHRDVKPSNVIVDPTGIPHLIDFGIARSKGDSSMTATGMMIGTPDFTAPETAAGAAASPASDAWQLAATVSYALSGYPPRGTRETPMAALMAAARAEGPSKLPRESAHARLLVASLDAEPRRRPTLNAVRNEVEGWLSRAGTSTSGPVTQIVPQVSQRTQVVPPRQQRPPQYRP